MLETVVQEEAFKLKGCLFTITMLQLLTQDLSQISSELKHLLNKAPKLFEFAPVTLDLMDHEIKQKQLQQICDELRQNNMIPIGVVGASEIQSKVAKACGLALFAKQKDKQQDLSLGTTATPKVKAEKSATFSKIIRSPIRSGQQVYAEGCDLIILSSVSQGCEILADGNIHVYGTLRGRALAGIKGHKQARIFCQNLDADLLSIAGNYMVHDTFQQHKQQGPRQIHLSGDKLIIEAL